MKDLFPGTDSVSVLNRMVHRSMHALSIAIEQAAGLSQRNDRVFPPHFFSASSRDPSAFAALDPKALFGRRIEQEKDKEKMQEGLELIHKKLRISLTLIFALAVVNIFLGIALFQLYKKKNK